VQTRLAEKRKAGSQRLKRCATQNQIFQPYRDAKGPLFHDDSNTPDLLLSKKNGQRLNSSHWPLNPRDPALPSLVV
jgi:hypothetical protein